MANRNKQSKNIKIGLTVLLAILLFYFGFNFLKGLNLFSQTNTYYVIFDNAKDISKSTQVTVDGYKVGLVRTVDLDYKNLRGITVEMALDKELRIPEGSVVALKGNPLSGAELVIIKNRNPQGYLEPNDTLQALTNADIIEQVSQDIIPSMVSMIGKMDTLIMGLDRVVNNEYIAKTFVEINAASENIRASSEDIRRMVANDVPKIVDNINQATASINDISERVNKVDIEKTSQDLNATIASLREIGFKLNQKDNSLGLLLNDHQLYDNLKSASKSADSLLIDLRTHPQRYVTFSLF